jgi:membrane fusion protein (multidrug efflux system)
MASTSPPVPDVVVYTVVAKPLSLYTEMPGRTSSFQTADARPQIDGIIVKRCWSVINVGDFTEN